MTKHSKLDESQSKIDEKIKKIKKKYQEAITLFNSKISRLDRSAFFILCLFLLDNDHFQKHHLE